jgi:hypothetical protein
MRQEAPPDDSSNDTTEHLIHGIDHDFFNGHDVVEGEVIRADIAQEGGPERGGLEEEVMRQTVQVFFKRRASSQVSWSRRLCYKSTTTPPGLVAHEGRCRPWACPWAAAR